MSEITITQLNIYPLKSARGLSLTGLSIGKMGPSMDRRWMVVNSLDGQFVSQRQVSQMCLIHVELDANTVRFSINGLDTIQLCIDDCQRGPLRDVTVWNDRLHARDCGDDIAQWLSHFLGMDVRLVFMADDCLRYVDRSFARQNEQVSFADGFPVLLISQASLDHFNQHLSQPISMSRFRPNIVVNGCAAYAEDQWQEIRVGGLTLSLVKPCSRCVIPSIDPETGIKNAEVSKALATHRRREGSVYFGQNLLVNGHGQLSLGDIVTFAA